MSRAGIRRKGGPRKDAGRSEFYGTGLRGRTVRAARDKKRLAQAQKDYERFVKEREENPRPPQTT